MAASFERPSSPKLPTPPSRYLSLLWYKALSELQAEASRSYMGFLWWIVEPALYMAAFYIAFNVGLRQGGENYVVFLLTGLVAWKWFGSTVQNGTSAITINVGLIQQVYLPKFILPGVVLIADTIKFLIIFLILAAVVVALGYPPNVAWLALPAVVLVEFILIAALASLGASVIPFFPDLKLFVDNGLIVAMFLSGVFFDVSKYPPRLQHIFHLNPMVDVIESYRSILLRGLWPDWRVLGLVALGSCIIYFIAYAILRKFDRVYPKFTIG